MAGECVRSTIQPKRMDIAMSDYGYWAETGEEVTESDYDDYLDSAYDAESIGLPYLGSEIVKEVDPVASRVGRSDWLDMMITDDELIDALEDEVYESASIQHDVGPHEVRYS